MFGVYHYAVDQGRITLPPRCRERFREGIALYTVGIAGFPVVSDEAKAVSKLDARGRLAIPPELRSFAGIVDTVVVIAGDDYIELWGEKNWALEQHAAKRVLPPTSQSSYTALRSRGTSDDS